MNSIKMKRLFFVTVLITSAILYSCNSQSVNTDNEKVETLKEESVSKKLENKLIGTWVLTKVYDVENNVETIIEDPKQLTFVFDDSKIMAIEKGETNEYSYSFKGNLLTTYVNGEKYNVTFIEKIDEMNLVVFPEYETRGKSLELTFIKTN
ncbi:MAG: lipocalin family protein [Chitinophagales bacterium]